MSVLLWGVLPYLAAALCAAGTVWRYRHDRFQGSTAPLRSDDPIRRTAILTFRTSVLLVLAMHIGEMCYADGDLVWMAGYVLGAVASVLSAITLLATRVTAPARRGVRPKSDWVLLPLMAAAVLTGLAIRFEASALTVNYLPRHTVIPWARSIVALHPDPALLAHAPLLCQARALIVLTLVAVWPMTRLINVFTTPICYLARHLPSPRQLAFSRVNGGR